MTSLTVLILFFSLHLKQIQSAPSHNQIDEFIMQLMTSEKFNELADIIAERAAKKIKTVEHFNLTTSRHSSNSYGHRDRKSNKDKPTHARKDILRERKIDEVNSGKFGKINTKAFLKHDLSSQELYLNYKYMTKRNKDQENVSSKNKDPENDSRNKFSDYSTEHLKEKTVKDEGKEWKNMKMKSGIEENVTKKHSVSTNIKHDYMDEDFTSNKTFTSKKINRNYQSSLEDSEERTQEIANNDKSNIKYKQSTQTTKHNIINDNFSDSSNESKREMTDHSDHTKETQEHKSLYSSKEVVEVGINRAFSDNDNTSGRHSNEKLDLTDSKEKYINKPIVKQIVRRENGKFYTFLSSPDYKEYHESLSNIKSSNNYINTYRY